MRILNKLAQGLRRHYDLPSRLETIQEALGRIEAQLQRTRTAADLRQFEFKVYSQWGEDGIIERLLQSVEVPNKVFVEFGVEDYTEANTLFLLKHRNWKGLVIDGSPRNIEAIRAGRVLWKYDLYAECSFITRENINELISRSGIAGDIGLLSVDIDGNDYWVWEAIECISPRIVISEYNSVFGPSATVSVPYRADFIRTAMHPSKLYYGASIGALTHLARTRGYSLVGGNSAGNNVFFVRNDCLGRLEPQPVETAYVEAAFRETRGPRGEVELLSFAQRQQAIGDLPVVDVVTGRQKPLKSAL
jgi:hypothetical protein